MKEKNIQDKFMELLEPEYGKLERFALSITHSRDEAKDLVGATVLKAYEKFLMLKDDKAFLSFIFTIARHDKIDRYRKNSRMNITEPDAFDHFKSNNLSPDVLTDISLLHEAINELKDKYRDALVLFEFSGLSHKEISKVQNITIASVKVRIHRARKKLAVILGVEDDSDSKKTNPKIKNSNYYLLVTICYLMV